LSQAPEHDADHSNVDPGFLTAREQFIVFGESAPRRKPGEGALDNPAVRKHMKTARSDPLPINHGVLWGPDASQATPGMCDDLDLPADRRLDPLAEAFLVVAAISPDQLEPREAPLERRKQELAAAVVLDVGFMDEHVQDQPVGINQQVAFATLDLLAPIVAASPPFCVVFTD